MNTFVKRTFGLGLLGLLAGVGAMQAEQQAKFHLPFPAVWGNVALPPGDYSVSLPEIGRAQGNFRLDGDRKAFINFMSSGEEQGTQKPAEHSYLTLRNVDGTYYVEKYTSGLTSKEFNFKVPKAHYKFEIGKQRTEKLNVTGE